MCNSNFKAALFDLDGVVFDTEPQYSVFWGDQFRRYYPEHPGMENLIKGMTLVQIFDEHFKDAETRRRITAELDEFERNMDFNYVAGFEDFVREIRANGVKTAVVTSSNLVKMENVFAKRPEFKSYFDAVLTSEDFDESKPSPDCYLKAAKRFGLDNKECVVFEDSFNGLKSGRAAGMFVVGLATTNAKEAIAGFSDLVVGDYNADAQLRRMWKKD